MFSPTALVYLGISFLILIPLIFRDFGKRRLFYLILFAIGAIGCVPFEYPLISMGLWEHMLEPQVLGVSLFASLLYIPFVGISYTFGRALSKKLKINEYLAYFISGGIIGFIIDITSTNLNFYQYHFTFPLKISGVPLGITVAEGLAIAITIFLAKKFSEIIIRFWEQRPHSA